ncbi:MAG: hypothetical protein J6W03_01555 [Bacteroidaceae bacterium]|nr:hypothetical protein [Bacteroidaceae bacterium]
MKKLLTLFAAVLMMLCVQNANADVTLTALRGSNYGAGEGPDKLVDGTNTKWGSGDDYPFVVLKANMPVKPTSYELTIANDTWNHTGRNWKKWKIYGGNFSSDNHAIYEYSSTGSTDPTSKGWVLLDDKDETLLTGTEADPYEKVSLTLSAPDGKYYSYFLIVINELAGGWGNYMQMAEFQFTNPTALEITGVASNNRFSSKGHEVLFDGDLGTKWECWVDWVINDSWHSFKDENGNVVFQTTDPVYVNGITLTTGNDTQSYPNRNPYEWILYGSNDDDAITAAEQETPDYLHESWTVIAHVNNCQLPAANKVAKKYKINPSQTAYKYFKFHVVRLVGKDELQLAELSLDYSIEPKTAIIADKIYSGGNYGTEVAANIFDGSGNTKWCKSNDPSTSWVTFSTVKPIVASSYSMQSGNDAEQRDPRTFKLYGATGDAAPTTDGSTTGWTLIDSEEDATGVLTTDHYAYANFMLDTPGIYQHFMLKVEQTRSVGDPHFQLSEFVLNEYDEYAEDYTAIGTDSEMAAFATAVNNGTSTGNAYLTADVNSTTSIGTGSHRYSGVFDGQGHVVTLNISGTNEYQGLIGYAADGAVIRNVITRGSVSGSKYCAGIIGGSNGAGTITISNCGNEADVTTTGINAAGIVGVNIGGNTIYHITNCYNTGTITSGGESAAISGWIGSTSSTVTNCYNSGSVTGVDSNTKSFVRGDVTYINCYTTLDAEDNAQLHDNYATSKVASGELCYQLNGSTNDGTTWTQTIGTDSHPVLFPASRTVHEYSTGIYTNLPVSNGYIQIGSAANLKQFAAEVNVGNQNLNAQLTTDINMSGESWPASIGYWGDNDWVMYGGHFDGQNHTISNLTYTTARNYHGLFGVITAGAVIENFSISGTITNTNYSEFGSAVGFARDNGPVIRNVHSFTNINNSRAGARIGGILGVAYNGTEYVDCCWYSGTLDGNDNGGSGNYGGIVGYFNNNADAICFITNCLFDGELKNTNATPGNCTFGGIVGYNNAGKATIENSLSIGTVTSTVTGQFFGKINGNNSVFANNYYKGSFVNGTGSGGTVSGTAPELVTDAQLASGEVCFNLGSAFTQLLGTDANPTLDSSKPHVYKLSVGSAGYASFVPEVNIAIIPTGVTAYVGQKKTANALHLEEVTQLPADNAFIVKAAEGNYYYNNSDEGITLTEDNDLTYYDEAFAATGTQYCLANKASGVGFYPVKSGVTIPARKAYLEITSGEAPVKGFYGFEEDDATGIDNLNSDVSANKTIYNVAGQRINKMQKGINIINGKKVLF